MLGVPPLLNKVSGAVAKVVLLGTAIASIFDLFGVTEWGIFEEGGGAPAIGVSSVLELTNTAQSQVSEYRMETGSFASFNKVQRARTINIRISKEGSPGERDSLIEWLETNVADTSVFDIVTPERAYESMTLISYSNRRESRAGISVLYVDCVFQEVRETEPEYTKSETEGSDTKDAAAADDVPSTPAAKTQTAEAPKEALAKADNPGSTYDYNASVNATEGGESLGIGWGNPGIDYNYQQSLQDAHSGGGM